MDNHYNISLSHGPCAANVYLNNKKYQLVLDWSYDSIYLKNDNNEWFVFTDNSNYYDNKYNTLYYNGEEWLHNIDIDIVKKYNKQFDAMYHYALTKLSNENNKSFDLLHKINRLLAE
jgi:hypothetical protein